MAQHEDRRRIISRLNVLQACLVVTFTVLAVVYLTLVWSLSIAIRQLETHLALPEER